MTVAMSLNCLLLLKFEYLLLLIEDNSLFFPLVKSFIIIPLLPLGLLLLFIKLLLLLKLFDS